MKSALRLGSWLLGLTVAWNSFAASELDEYEQLPCGDSVVCYLVDKEGEGFLHPVWGAKRKDALKRGIEMWTKVLTLPVPLKIKVRFSSAIPRGTDAWATHSYGMLSWSFPFNYASYPLPLANQLKGESITHSFEEEKNFLRSAVHGYIEFSQLQAVSDGEQYHGFYYDDDLSALTGTLKSDFQSVVAHEFAHILGVESDIDSNTGEFKYTYPTAYDIHLHYPLAPLSLFWNNWPMYNGLRRQAINSSVLLYWGGIEGNFLARQNDFMYSGCNCTGDLWDYLMIIAEGNTPSHFAQRQCLLMGPSKTAGTSHRSLDVTPGVLADIGYNIIIEPILDIGLPSRGPSNPAYKDNFDSENVIPIQNSGPIILDAALIVENDDLAEPFSLTTAATFSLRPWEFGLIRIGFIAPPGTQSIYTGKLTVASNDPSREIVTVQFANYKDMPDSDEDGLADDAETFDFDEGGGFYNPFDSEEPDSTGNDGATASDGILDGFNDFDDDGVTNMAEFDLGYDPLDPGDHPTLEDTDGDGLSDYDELRDLDFTIEGIQNPLDPWRPDGDEDGVLDGEEDNDGDGIPNAVELAHPTIFDVLQEDVTGDDGALAPDTILDGENDFDNDGISNEDEVRYGLDIVVYTAIGDIEWHLCVDE